MKRAPIRSPANRKVAPEQSANHCRAIVPVDGTAIRRKIKKAYETSLRDLEKTRRQLDQFHQTDQPKFNRWLNSHFGALLTELRELGQKLAADEALVFLVENEVLFGGGSYARAYQRVMELRENPEPLRPPPTGSSARDGEREAFDARLESENFDGEEDPLETIFKELFGEFEPGEHSQGKRDSRTGRRIKSAPPAPAVARLKELYRAVVRRLHPDLQREMTAQKAEWWHQAQAAYEAGDAEQLEVVLTLCEIGDTGTTAHTSASLLQRITAQLKSSLREIKRQLARMRRDPAWNFSQRADHDTMARQMRRALMSDLEGMRYQCRQIQELIARWKAASELPKRPQRRKRHPQGMEFPF